MHQISAKKIQHLKHPLNSSKSKSAFAFAKASRFSPAKNYSPNKFYDAPSSFHKRSISIGLANKANFQKNDYVEPSRYVITSSFDSPNKTKPHGFSFGINRDYYRGRQSSSNIVGPAAYHVQGSFQNPKKNFYIGRRVEPVQDKHNVSSFSYGINDSYNKLSNHKNEGNTYRMKTEYYPKSHLQPFDNKVPGPGACNKPNIQTEVAQIRRIRIERKQILLLEWVKNQKFDLFTRQALAVSINISIQQYFFLIRSADSLITKFIVLSHHQKY